MNKYTLEEAREKLTPFGISISEQASYEGEVYGHIFYSCNNERMEKADGYNSQPLEPSDFNMIIEIPKKATK